MTAGSTGRERRARILEIISTREIGTQKELLEALRAAGFAASQATVSRDIQSLQLKKECTRSGRRCYVPGRPQRVDADEALGRLFHESVVAVGRAGNLVVIRTVNAGAGTVAAAVDRLDFSEVVGTVAGDDTLFVALPTESAAEALEQRFAAMVDTDRS